MTTKSTEAIRKESEATWQAIVEYCRQLRVSGQPNLRLEQLIENRDKWLGFSSYAKVHGMTFEEVKRLHETGNINEDYIQYLPMQVDGKKYDFWRIRNLPLEQLLKK